MSLPAGQTTLSSINPAVVDTSAGFNTFCRDLIVAMRRINSRPGHPATFDARMQRVLNIQENIRTPWGGVDIVLRKDPEIEKFLIIKGGTWLAYEKHSEKQESLVLSEGMAILLHRRAGADEIDCDILEAGTPRYLAPGEEHCLIAVNDALVFEKSLDFKGMDNDLIFLQSPDQSMYLLPA